jgi:predicted kinase
MNSLTLIRGLPGSGKSTLAKSLVGNHLFKAHFEADMYFMQYGMYKWEASKVGAAHEWCQTQVKECLPDYIHVVVSNTFTTISELRPYFKIAKLYGIVPNVITCQSEFGSIHNVPAETMAKMKARFANDISILYKESNEAQNNNG